jgi:hypothetical protein
MYEEATDRADSLAGKIQPDSTKGNFQYAKDKMTGDSNPRVGETTH